MKFLELTGRENKDLITWDAEHGILVHKNMQEPLRDLVSEAQKEGISISLVSGYRNFERQLAIWNAKATGTRKLLDRDENVVNFEQASEDEILESILTWSALPGASRHHWGTEIDIFDVSIKTKDKVQLTQEEAKNDFQNLYNWIDKNIENYPFHRPYDIDLGGVAREPWHLSYTPLSEEYQRHYTFEVLKKNVEAAQIELKDAVLRNLERIYSNFITNVSPAT